AKRSVRREKSSRRQFLVAAVAHRLVARALAGTEPSLLGLFRLELDRREARALVRAVTERLLLGAPAGTPPVALAGFHVDRDRSSSADFRCRVHLSPSSFGLQPCLAARLRELTNAQD